MSKKSLILSSEGLKNLTQNQNYNEEFTFIFGKHEIKMNNLYAEFISPYVSKIHQSDPTISSINFSLQNPKSSRSKKNLSKYLNTFSEEVYSLFKSISTGNSLTISKSHISQLKIISILLKNDELYSKLDSLFENDDIDSEKLDFMLFLLDNEEIINISETSEVMKSIARNFHSIDQNKIIQLSATVFYRLISQEDLNIESEDELVEIIDKFFEYHEREGDEDIKN